MFPYLIILHLNEKQIFAENRNKLVSHRDGA